MSDGSGPLRIEIEPTPDAASPSPWARREPGSEPPAEHESEPVARPAAVRAPFAPPSGPPARPTFFYPDAADGDGTAPDGAIVSGSEPAPTSFEGVTGERKRLVVTAVAAGVIALVLGWALGRGGDDTATRTVDGTPVTTPAGESVPPTTVADSGLPGDTLPRASVPTTVPVPTTARPAPTTTTTLPPAWESTTVALDARLAGATDRLVAVDFDGQLVEVDLASGTTRSLSTRVGNTISSPAGVAAGAGWVMLPTDDGRPPRVFVDQGELAPIVSEVDADDGSSVYWEIGTDRVWTIDYDQSSGVAIAIVPYDVRTGETGEPVSTNGMWPAGTDPAGGVIVGDGLVGMFSVSDAGSRRFPSGRPVAIGRDQALVYRCGDTLDDCALAVVDRSTGEERIVPIEAEAFGLTGDWWSAPSPLPQLTADGRYASVVMRADRADGFPVTAVLDTTTGVVTTFEADPDRGPILTRPAWSSDDRWLFVIIDGVPHAYDPATGEQFPISTDPVLASIRHLTVGPAA